jgi:acetyl esterase/lipase
MRLLAPLLAAALLPSAAPAQPRPDPRGPVTVERDIPYAGGGNPRQRLDLYLPAARGARKLPVIVFIHGGGWMNGDKDDGADRLVPFVRSGEYAGVSVGYRLTGEAIWPAQVHDVKAAVRWVRANASRYGLDSGRIGAWGRSAGAHLALLLGTSGDATELEGELGPHRAESSAVAAVANEFGVTDMLAVLGQPSDIDRARRGAPEARLLGGAITEHPERARAASPVTYVTPGDPPVLTLHGTADRTVPYDQAVRLDAALKKAGVTSYFVTVRGGGHGRFGSAADERTAAFFARHLLGKGVEVPTSPITPTE